MTDQTNVELIETNEFYEGVSSHPIHQALGLRLPTIKLAHLSVSREKIEMVQRGEIVPFTPTEERTFAMLQLRANKYLQTARKGPLLPLLHLSIRMLLPYDENPRLLKIEEVPTEPSIKTDVNDKDVVLAGQKKGKKKRKKPKLTDKNQIDHTDSNDGDSNRNANSNNNTVEPIESSHESIERISSITIPSTNTSSTKSEQEASPTIETLHEDSSNSTTVSTSLATIVPRHFHTLSVPVSVISPFLASLPPNDTETQMRLFDICSTYERQIMNIRETYENAIQAANLKNFIATNEIEKLKEALEECTSKRNGR